MSIPNGAVLGGENKYALLNKLKREGLVVGAPDLVLLNKSPRGNQPCAIEVKRAGGKLQHAQRAYFERMCRLGWTVVVAYGARDGIAKLKWLGY